MPSTTAHAVIVRVSTSVKRVPGAQHADDDVGIERSDCGDDLVDLALAYEGLGNGRIEALGEGADDFCAVGLGKPAQLGERIVEKPFGPAEVDAHEDGAFGDERRGVMLKARHRGPPR